jgi:hypothetical protein
MKKIVAGILFLGITLFGADYTAMSLDDLLLQKGSIPEADRAAFQSAMQSKMGALSPEERANIQNANGGQGQKIQKKDGTGGGNMNKGTKGQGGGRF